MEDKTKDIKPNCDNKECIFTKLSLINYFALKKYEKLTKDEPVYIRTSTGEVMEVL